MKRITVETSNNNYDIVITHHFDLLNQEIDKTAADYSKIAIISDDLVAPLYLDEVKERLSEKFDCVYTYVFENGEKNKHLGTITEFYSFLIENGFDRKSLLIALGGGVTGDMVGFTASTFMRGIRFIQVPTTILSQVDSSVGGKTGVDFEGYKNAIGAFYQPELVYINTSVLKSLPPNEFASGMAEVIKYGIIQDRSYFDFLENNMSAIKELDHEVVSKMIKTSCETKSRIVAMDEKENGIRAILNFGHTIGHAIERMKDFKLLHGECVAIGMASVTYISKALNRINQEEVDRILDILKAYDLPINTHGLEADAIYQELFHDKKTSHNQLKFILSDSIGSCYIDNSIGEIIVIDAINQVLK